MLCVCVFSGGLGLKNVVFIFDTFCFEGGQIIYVLFEWGRGGGGGSVGG